METYFIQGADGNEYGPATLDQLRQWYAEGRIIPTTPVRVSSTQARVTAGQLLTTAPNFPPQSPYRAPAPQPAPQQNGLGRSILRYVAFAAVASIVSCGFWLVRMWLLVANEPRSTPNFELETAEKLEQALSDIIDKGPGVMPDTSSTATIKQALTASGAKPEVVASVDKFVFNASISKRDVSDLESYTILMFKAPQPQKDGKTVVCTLDRECQLVSAQELAELESAKPQPAPKTGQANPE